MHLVANSCTSNDLPKSISGIYDKLFQKIANRDWSNEGQISELRNIEAADIKTCMQDLAFMAYTNKRHYLLRSELASLGSAQKFMDDLRRNGDDVSKYLMISFYMREVKEVDEESDNRKNYAIEFVHDSLQYFLVAEEMWEKVCKIISDTTSKGKNKILIHDTANGILKILFSAFHHKPLSEDILKYLLDIILEEKNTDKPQLFQQLNKFAEELLESNFLDFVNSTIKPIDAAINTFYGYWFVMSILSEGNNTIPKEGKVEFCKLLQIHTLQRFQGHRWNLKNANLSDSILSKINLSNANLEGANFSNTNLSFADFSNADLRNANFYNADLSFADFYGAKIDGADFSGAKLFGVQNLFTE